jgi:cytochrome c oxidase cbb3-type subunit 3
MRHLLTLLAMSVALCAACSDSRPNDALPQVVLPDSSDDVARGDTVPFDSITPLVRTSDLRAGGGAIDMQVRDPFADDPEGTRDGRTLFMAMNCSGCHGAAGGGGIGPPLSDEDWIYGSRLENIVQTIVQGRPNGMPSYGGRLPQGEMWKIAAYVQSLRTATSSTTPTKR